MSTDAHHACIAITHVARWICPSRGRLVSLVLQVRHFRCPNRVCPRYARLALPLPHLLLPCAQRTSRLRESLRELGEEGGGQAGARISKQQGMARSASTVLRLLRQGPLPTPPPVKALGVDEWVYSFGQSFGTAARPRTALSAKLITPN
jgi:transposase